MRTFTDDLKDLGAAVEDMPCKVVVSCPPRCHSFATLREAKRVFPSLDPFHNTKDFTWAMREGTDEEPVMRFEDWKANDLFSI